MPGVLDEYDRIVQERQADDAVTRKSEHMRASKGPDSNSLTIAGLYLTREPQRSCDGRGQRKTCTATKRRARVRVISVSHARRALCHLKSNHDRLR